MTLFVAEDNNHRNYKNYYKDIQQLEAFNNIWPAECPVCTSLCFFLTFPTRWAECDWWWCLDETEEQEHSARKETNPSEMQVTVKKENSVTLEPAGLLHTDCNCSIFLGEFLVNSKILPPNLKASVYSKSQYLCQKQHSESYSLSKDKISFLLEANRKQRSADPKYHIVVNICSKSYYFDW